MPGVEHRAKRRAGIGQRRLDRGGHLTAGHADADRAIPRCLCQKVWPDVVGEEVDPGGVLDESGAAAERSPVADAAGDAVADGDLRGRPAIATR